MRQRAVKIVAVMVVVVGVSALWSGGATAELAQPQEEFVPIDQLPPDDQLPAAPLLVAAYGIVWIVVFAYLWSIMKRQRSVERDLSDLSRRSKSE